LFLAVLPAVAGFNNKKVRFMKGSGVIIGVLVLGGLVFYCLRNKSTGPAVPDPLGPRDDFDGDPARKGLSKPQRYHNPGAIMKPGGMEMVYYNSDYEGMVAMLSLLEKYVGRGDNTIFKIVCKWAGATPGSISTSIMNYVSFVSDGTKIDKNTVVTLKDLPSIAYRMHRFEAGVYWLLLSEFENAAKNMGL
jgi:hypothetical protein